MKQRRWKSTTSDRKTVEQSGWNSRTSDGKQQNSGKEMVEQWNRDGGTVQQRW